MGELLRSQVWKDCGCVGLWRMVYYGGLQTCWGDCGCQGMSCANSPDSFCRHPMMARSSKWGTEGMEALGVQSLWVLRSLASAIVPPLMQIIFEGYKGESY